jgi:hypothetical protein
LANAHRRIIGEAVVVDDGLIGEIARVVHVVSIRNGDAPDARAPSAKLIAKAGSKRPVLKFKCGGWGRSRGNAHANGSEHEARCDCFAKIDHQKSPTSVPVSPARAMESD